MADTAHLNIPGPGNECLARLGEIGDSSAISEIYNEGIDDRVATFETEHRNESSISAWFESACPIVVVDDNIGSILAFAAGFPYRARQCYSGILEFSVYTRRQFRGKGFGRLALQMLIEIAAERGVWKLLSRIFPENAASRKLCGNLGFREVGVYERHAKLDGQWRNVVIVEKLIGRGN